MLCALVIFKTTRAHNNPKWFVSVCSDRLFIDDCFRIQNFTSSNHNIRDIMNETEEASKHQYEPPDIVELLTVNSATVSLLSKLGFR